jgi:hypothetical protein
MELGIVGGFFAEKVRAVRSVERFGTDPVGRGGHDVTGVVGGDFVRAGIVKTTVKPLPADGDAVFHEQVRMSAPHFDCGMILPTVGWVGEGVENLQRFDALLTEAAVVEASGRCGEVGIWEKGLHVLAPSAVTFSYVFAAVVFNNLPVNVGWDLDDFKSCVRTVGSGAEFFDCGDEMRIGTVYCPV